MKTLSLGKAVVAPRFQWKLVGAVTKEHGLLHRSLFWRNLKAWKASILKSYLFSSFSSWIRLVLVTQSLDLLAIFPHELLCKTQMEVRVVARASVLPGLNGILVREITL